VRVVAPVDARFRPIDFPYFVVLATTNTPAANQLRGKGKTDKADAAQRECDEMREQFEAAGRDTLDVVETANLVCEHETVDQLADYLEVRNTTTVIRFERLLKTKVFRRINTILPK
jgi:predicted aconitase